MALFSFLCACTICRHPGEQADSSPDSGRNHEQGTLDEQSHEVLTKRGQARRDCTMQELDSGAECTYENVAVCSGKDDEPYYDIPKQH